MLQRIGIRWKLLAVVALPVLLLLTTMGYIVATNVQTYRAYANVEQLIQALDISRGVKEDLQTERRAGVNFAHTVRTASANIATQSLETATRYGTLAERAAQTGDERAAAVVADVTAALGGAPGAGMLDAQHALTITPPSAAVRQCSIADMILS